MDERRNRTWVQRLLTAFSRRPSPDPDAHPASPTVTAMALPPVEATAEATVISPLASPDGDGGWREVLKAGQVCQVAWTLAGGPRDGQCFNAHAKVRAALGDDAWLRFDREISPDDVPPPGQAVVLRVSRPDGLRLVPAQVTADSRGGSLVVAISGRVVRLQRRDFVRAQVDMPPLSVARLAPNGAPVGVLGATLVDLGGGGVQLTTTEPLDRDDRLRLNLKLDGGPPIVATLTIVESRAGDLLRPPVAHGCFGEMPERERTRILQYVYGIEIENRRAEAAGRD